jgi:NAD(P)-dependent dehydrogenase (short-subunit alcohol dehydrogenase family)
MGRKSGFTECDVSKKEEVSKLVADAVKFGGGKLDVFVNAAGVICTQDLMNATTEDFHKLFDVNVLGTSNALQAGLDVMMKQNFGNIITVSSIAGRTNMGMLQHYCASKAAVISFTQAGAKKGAPYGVRVNSIAPGIIRTAMWEEILDGMASGWNGREGAAKQTPEEREANWNNSVKAFIPLGHAQEPEDISWGTVFMASEFARNITGQVLTIDGGTVMV